MISFSNNFNLKQTKLTLPIRTPFLKESDRGNIYPQDNIKHKSPCLKVMLKNISCNDRINLKHAPIKKTILTGIYIQATIL